MKDISQSLLLVVDVQNAFVNEQTQHIIIKINRLLRYWRAEKGTVVFSRFINIDEGPWERLRGWSECKTAPDILLHAALDSGDDMVIDKHTYSAWGDDLIQLCTAHVLGEVVLCGIDTNECVMATAIDIFDHGFRPIVVSDACASASGEKFHESALLLLEKLLGREQIIASNEIMVK